MRALIVSAMARRRAQPPTELAIMDIDGPLDLIAPCFPCAGLRGHGHRGRSSRVGRANFVITTFRAGIAARHRRTVPLHYDAGPGDYGAGGFAMALRSIPSCSDTSTMRRTVLARG